MRVSGLGQRVLYSNSLQSFNKMQYNKLVVITVMPRYWEAMPWIGHRVRWEKFRLDRIKFGMTEGIQYVCGACERSCRIMPVEGINWTWHKMNSRREHKV